MKPRNRTRLEVRTMFCNKKTISLVLGTALALAVAVANADYTFGEPVNLGPTVNTGYDEVGQSISADGLSFYFSSERGGGYGDWDLWRATRETTSDPWGEPVNLGPTVNSSADELWPRISADGLELYFAEYGFIRPGGYGSADLWVTKRSTRDDPWGAPVNLGETVNSSSFDAHALILPDGLTLCFGSTRPGGYGGVDIWMTRRATDADPWGTPVNLGPTINSSSNDGLPSLSANGSTLYFGSGRSDGFGGYDLWQASVIPIVDFNGDDKLDGFELRTVGEYWGTDDSRCDIGPVPWGDGVVDEQDLIVLIEHIEEAGAAGPQATKTPVTGTRFVTPSGQTPTREWIDEEGVTYIRGSVAIVEYEGDLVGPGVAVVNLNLDFATGTGDESGYLTAELTRGELRGTFAGRFSITYTGWVGVGHGVYHGTGDFAGMKLTEDFVADFTDSPEPPWPVEYEGIIFDPHGK